MLISELDSFISSLDTPTDPIRLKLLDAVVEQIHDEGCDSLIFVCTHNSRRSQLSHIWAHIMASHFDIPIGTHSAGTEATAFNIRAVDALRRAGLEVEEEDDSENPVYFIRYSPDKSRIQAWSKTLDDPSLPQERFTAVMTCSDADENCPFMPGAAARIPLRYVDPKQKDDTPQEMEDYDARCHLIASEMKYIMSIAAKRK